MKSRKTKRWVVRYDRATNVVEHLKKNGFKPRKARTYTDDLGNIVTIGPLNPPKSGERIIESTPGAVPIIEKALEK